MANLNDSITTLNHRDPDFLNQCTIISNDVLNKKITILNVVEKLEDLLSSSDVECHEEGLHILSTILEKLPITALNHDEVVQFCTFYKARFNENYRLIPPLLTGILALSKYDLPMSQRCFTEILTTMFQTVSCQVQRQQERMKIYQILQTMLRTQTQELLDLGPDFIYGVISAIDGERDPRSLLWLFEWLPEFVGTVKLGHLSEEMFDVMSCYFPVDFRVSAQNANGISRDVLAEALKPCLCASPEFAQETIKLAIEKLDSDLQIAKMDSLQLLSYGCKKFPIDIYIEYKSPIWSSLQQELLKCPSLELEQHLITTVTEISNKLSGNHQQFVDVFNQVLETNIGNLNVTAKLFKTTWKLFLAMSKGNEKCARQVVPDIQPRLINLFNITATKEHKLEVLKVLVEFIKVGNDYNASIAAIPHFLLMVVAQQDPEMKAIALDSLCYIKYQIDEQVKLMLLEQFGKLFVEESTGDLKKAFHGCILYYSKIWSEDITNLLNAFDDNEKVDNLLDNFSYLSGHNPFTADFFKLLNQKFAGNRRICLKVLRQSLEFNVGNENIQLELHQSGIVESKLMDLENLPNEIEDLENTKEILNRIVGSYNSEQQILFLSEHKPSVIQAMYSEKSDLRCMYILSGIMTKLYPQNLVHFKECNILNKLFRLSFKGNQIAVELLANIVNKWPSTSGVDAVIQSYEAELRPGVSFDVNLDKFGFLVVWLTKALYMRGHENKHKWLNLLIEYLPRTETVAFGIKTIMSDECDSLALSSHAERKLLYRQQFFIEMCQKLDEGFDVNNKNYIIAFANLICEVPEVILKMNFEKLMRLIMLCLDKSNEPTGLVPILTTIKNFIDTKDALSQQYMDDFIPRLLTLSRFKSMEVRILALQCVKLYVNGFIPVHTLLPHKTKVIDALGVCIDDRKRLVRKEAVDARLKWFLLGAPM